MICEEVTFRIYRVTNDLDFESKEIHKLMTSMREKEGFRGGLCIRLIKENSYQERNLVDFIVSACFIRVLYL